MHLCRHAGLALTPSTPEPLAWMTAPTDSFNDFMAGWYGRYRRWFHSGDGRHYRRLDRDGEGNLSVGVSIDPSVWARWQSVPGYRPRTLTDARLIPPE
ncbi:hypothetical protein [uncultured Oceanisphaera sp.]|uniref:hypothetical protein n=1 Tax=uncultured Oceanisphaera sp. TaxID=353858 RepID=UPI002621AF3C|nr:hypothetical protein [uncultured Oceanisphaera sp.]